MDFDFDLAALRLQKDQKSAELRSRANRPFASAKSRRELQAARIRTEKRMAERSSKIVGVIEQVTHILSFLGTSFELFNLALTCKSFGWQQPASGLDWSLAEEVARQVVCSGRNTVGARVTLSRGTRTWLSILRETEHPLKFDTLLGRGIEHANERRTFIHTDYGICTAVASNYVMESGVHYAELSITGKNYIGIVRPMPNLDPARYANDGFSFFKRSLFDDFLAARTDEWGAGNVHVCYYSLYNGTMGWTNWAGEEQLGAVWEGRGERCRTGATVGMLLNLDDGTLTVYKNNRRLGVMKDGLSGSYCWYACGDDENRAAHELNVMPVWPRMKWPERLGDTVTIKRCEPPRERRN